MSEKNEMGDIVDYFGTPLRRKESDVLMEIFSLEEEIPPFKEGPWFLVIEDTHVTRLEIYENSLTSLPESIENLKALSRLYIRSRIPIIKKV